MSCHQILTHKITLTKEIGLLNKRTVKQADVAGKKVLVRVDFNVPMQDGKISNLTRIEAGLPTIEYLASQKAKVIILSHLGQPHGFKSEEMSLKPVAELISKLMNKKVEFISTSVLDDQTKLSLDDLKPGEIAMVENLRFDLGEEENDPAFTKKLAELGEIYINDAFGTCHRKHASIYGIGEYLPSYGGFLMEKEIEFMGEALKNPQHEFTVINHLMEKVDNILIGGGMAFTFFKAMGYEIGKSILDEDNIEYAKGLMQKAKELGINLILPTDVVVAQAFDNDAHTMVVPASQIPKDYLGLDIGPKTCEEFEKVILRSKTIVWNGPMGAFELPSFAQGTKRVADAMTRNKGVTIVGGGDSAAAIDQFGLQDKVTHISTGGGASLEFLEGKLLPGISILLDD